VGHHDRLPSLGNVQSATIAVVAPPIAEALIATAMGLFAAIPAVHLRSTATPIRSAASRCVTTPSWRSSRRSSSATRQRKEPQGAAAMTRKRHQAPDERDQRRAVHRRDARAAGDLFMITAPLLTQGIKVDSAARRRRAARPGSLRDNEPLMLSIDRDGLMYLNIGGDEEVAGGRADGARRGSAAIIRRNAETPVLVKGRRGSASMGVS
jgi:hypothetical protein